MAVRWIIYGFDVLLFGKKKRNWFSFSLAVFYLNNAVLCSIAEFFAYE